MTYRFATSNERIRLVPTISVDGNTFLRGELNKPVTIVCCDTKNENPVTGTISLNGLFVETTVVNGTCFKNTSYVTENLHGAAVGCTLYYKNNPGAYFESFVLYVIKEPRVPKLKISDDLLEHENELVTCISKETRPKHQQYFVVDEKHIESILMPTNLNTSEVIGYIKHLEGIWNNRLIQCCVYLEGFEDLCSKRIKLTISFPPKHVTFKWKEIEISATESTINFTCTVGPAYPPCKAVLHHSGTVTKKGNKTVKDGNGYYNTVNQRVTFYGLPDEHIVDCYSVCEFFNDTLQSKFFVAQKGKEPVENQNCPALTYMVCTIIITVLFVLSILSNVYQFYRRKGNQVSQQTGTELNSGENALVFQDKNKVSDKNKNKSVLEMITRKRGITAVPPEKTPLQDTRTEYSVGINVDEPAL